ncbi:hypothetical protein F4809DRAFT_653469 [Biscogniauxia mediterranea]|nr:hypothetical protein F4809DRAFT_653469 [Biscogniauxia mediterranea]
MPPRPSSLLRLPLRVGSRSLCPSSSSSSTTPSRLFSRTPAASSTANQIPPESPLFINVPHPPQGQSIEERRELKPVKGYLPVPRTIFPKRDGHLKPRGWWLARATPEPTSPRRLRLLSRDKPLKEQAQHDEKGRPRRLESEYQAYKRRMAALRREHLRSGVRDLWARKRRADTRRTKRQTALLASHREAMLAPEREDERLTRPTVPAALLQTAVALDPNRFERALESRARSEAIAARKSEARRDAIQELYMNARGFIVDESELEARVNDLFSPDYWRKKGTAVGGLPISNIWDLLGKPRSVQQMLSDVARSNSELIKSAETESTRTVKRQKLVAEELTGGKMD